MIKAKYIPVKMDKISISLECDEARQLIQELEDGFSAVAEVCLADQLLEALKEVVVE